MTFGLISWLKQQYPDLNYEVPLWYPSRDQPDQREWLITNGMGGYASSTVSGAHRRRYHALLVSALAPPDDRHVVLSKVDELLTVDGVQYELATNHWTSGVVSPTGYKYLESFTTLPVPTWVYELGGHILIKQVALIWGSDVVQVGYQWIPDPEREPGEVKLAVRFLTGFRSFHGQVRGSSDDRYPQFLSAQHSIVALNDSNRRLCLTWSDGTYEAQKQWWWDFHWPEETARALPDSEDLYLLGCVTTRLQADRPFSVAASLDKPMEKPDCKQAVAATLSRQKELIKKAALPKVHYGEQLVLACDQFLVSETPQALDNADEYVIEGYPWFNESGRAAMIGLPGLTLATRRFDDAKRLIRTYARRMVNGLLPNRFFEDVSRQAESRLEYGAADITLWWAWAMYQYYQKTKDLELIREQFPALMNAAKQYVNGTTGGIKADTTDGLLRCARAQHEFTWMDTKVAGIPITPRSGKAVEICALWYNFLETIAFFAAALEIDDDSTRPLQELAARCKTSMQKFWNIDQNCLFDVIEPGHASSRAHDQSIRPNQILAVSLPFRSLTAAQEKAVLICVEAELLTAMGMRSLSASDPGYQGIFGCGFAHADQYHRDLSYHNGMAWPFLLGVYCDALVNVFGLHPETTSRVNLILQPLLQHVVEEGCLGSVCEIFDGSRPHLPRGCFAYATSVAEVMRWLNWQSRR